MTRSMAQKSPAQWLFRDFGEKISSAEPFENFYPLQQRVLEAYL
jgi:hypothetical protein